MWFVFTCFLWGYLYFMINRDNLSYFYLFFNWFFFNFIYQHWIDLNVIFIVYFNLIYVELSWSGILNHMFDSSTQVELIYFFRSFIKLILFSISFLNVCYIEHWTLEFIFILFYRVFMVLWYDIQIDILTLVDSNQSSLLLSWFS